MASWTILGTGRDGNTQGKTFGISLNTSNNTWRASGPSVDLFFKSKTGNFKFAAIPESGTQLVNESNNETAFFRALLRSSVVGSKGTGRASEKGVNFDWLLQSH